MYSVPEALKSGEETEKVADADGRHAGIIVGLILSIDRRESAEAALETVSAFESRAFQKRKLKAVWRATSFKSQGSICKI